MNLSKKPGLKNRIFSRTKMQTSCAKLTVLRFGLPISSLVRKFQYNPS